MSEVFQLPALKSLGELAGAKPVIVIDTREQDPLAFSRLQSVRGTLTSGDYSFRGAEQLFTVERKSVDDLAACCVGENRARFERELHRLRGFRFKRLLIVGTELEIQAAHYNSRIAPRAVFSTLSAFEVRYDLAITFKASPELAAKQIESWAFWFAREMIEGVNDLWRSTQKPSENESGHDSRAPDHLINA
jgi:DNA excision repair protein ERCC-4